MYPFERFTERAKHVLTYAQEEAQRAGHNQSGTEHLPLGLRREEEGMAAKVLADLGSTSTGPARASETSWYATRRPSAPRSVDRV
jgi:ATP-dependent Clp protease ATP-binding subunit ClpA